MTDTQNEILRFSVALDTETEAIVQEVIQERNFRETQGRSLALRTIIREWHAFKTAAPVQDARGVKYPDFTVVGQ